MLYNLIKENFRVLTKIIYMYADNLTFISLVMNQNEGGYIMILNLSIYVISPQYIAPTT